MATESGKGVVTTRTTIEAVERLEGAVQARLRQMSKGRLRELIPRAIDGRFRLCIPPMDDDDDLILSALIDEVFALRERMTAATARYTDLWDAFHEEQRLRNRRVDWQEADTRELLRSEYGIDAAAKPEN